MVSAIPKHKAQLQKLLQLADVYSAECERDVVLARNMGFTGQAMPVIPNAGGFSQADFAIPRLDPSERKTIALKGYHGWVGRAKVSLEAVREMSEELQGYKIIVYSANKSVLKLAKQVSKQTGLEIKAFGKGALLFFSFLFFQVARVVQLLIWHNKNCPPPRS